MEYFQKKLKNPIYLMLTILFCIILYMTLSNYCFEIGQKLGKEISALLT